MPLLKLQCTSALVGEVRDTLIRTLSRITAECIGQPERYVMVVAEQATFSLDGQIGPAAFVDVRSITGLGGEVNRRIAHEVCAALEKGLGIPADRIFLNFQLVEPANWGYNGSTVG
ncbi:MAG TPA: phenylpyruvate tautomerase MIF-related protein [Thermoanaerobaculaceae bacterium]|nr:phenylpyruvate tautomerase MIF-related protein [Thermoanaerobaculaceae bacterium]